jgi:hypothetical protein
MKRFRDNFEIKSINKVDTFYKSEVSPIKTSYIRNTS